MISKKKYKSEFSRNAITLIVGSTIARAIPIAISPIITRIYTPEDFGVFALYTAIASIAAIIATGRYEMAIMLPKKDSDAINIVALSIMLSFFVSSVFFLIIYLFNEELTSALNNKNISDWLYFVPLTVLLTGIYQSFNYWLNRKKKYKNLSNVLVVQSGSTSVVNIGMGVGGLGSSGLIIGSVAGQALAASILGKCIWKEDWPKRKDLNKAKMIALIIRYIKFPKYNLPNALIDGFRLSGISILMANIFSTATLGQFSLAWKMVQIPTGVIGASLSQVFFQKIACADRADLHGIIKKYLLKTSLLALPMFLAIYVFAVDIFEIAFGENWSLAGQAASIMAPWLYLSFLSSPMANVFIVINKQEVTLFVSLIYLVLPITILALLSEVGFIQVLNLITLTMSIVLIFYIFLALKYTDGKYEA